MVLSAITRGLFAARRKTIRNNMAAALLPSGILPEDALRALEKEGADPGARAEELPPETFLRTAKALAARVSQDLREPSSP